MKPRIRVEGSAYYITSIVYGRLAIFTRSSFVIPLIDSLNFYRYHHQCKLLGYVVMPDHIHMIIWPQEGSNISDFMRDFKRFTSGRISRQAFLENKTDWMNAFEQAGRDTSRAEHKVWQDCFWEEVVFTDEFLHQKLNYIHMNPVRAGLVDEPQDYPYSSYRNYELEDDTLIEMDMDWA
jgi:REP element-mobilizing transposase RayT